MIVSLPLVGPSYADETASYGREESINLIPEVSGSEGTRERFMLRNAAGLTALTTALTGPVRGIREMGGILYVVAGESLFSVSDAGVIANLGTVLGSGRCILTDNFIPATSRQLVIMTGERGYVYDTLTGFQEITDTDFTDVATFETATFLDGYVIAETEDGFIYSAVTDATDWNALDFATAESAPDRVLAVWAVYGDLWVFGGRTIEIFRNTGDADNPFERVQTIEKGCGARYSMANLDNSVFWIDETGRVYRASGFNPTRISTHAVEQYLSSVDFAEAFGFTYVDRGHEFYGFTVPSGQTHLYDVATGLWSRRKSENVDRWRASCQARCYGSELFGDYATGTIWMLDSSSVTEGSARLIRERITAVVHEDASPLFVSTLDLTADTGNALQTGDPEQTDPVIEMRYHDEKRGWSNWKARSIGAIGERGKRIRWHRLGRTRQRSYHFRISDPIRCDLISLATNVEAGDQA